MCCVRLAFSHRYETDINTVFESLFDTVQRPRTIPVVAAAFKCTPLHASFAQQNYFNATMRTMCESRYEDGAADFSASDCSAGCSPCVYMQNANGLYAHLGGVTCIRCRKRQCRGLKKGNLKLHPLSAHSRQDSLPRQAQAPFPPHATQLFTIAFYLRSYM